MKKSNMNNTTPTVRQIWILLFISAFIFFGLMPSLTLARDKNKALNESYRDIAAKMKELHENGELHEIIILYKNECCKKNPRSDKDEPYSKEKEDFKKVNKEIRADIYQFIALASIALNRPELGETYVRKILVLRRGEGTDQYWLSIRKLSKNRYYVAPRFLVGVKLGANLTYIDPGKRYSVLIPSSPAGENDYRKKYVMNLSDSRAMHAGLVIEYALTPNFSVSLQPSITNQKFRYENTYIRGDDTNEPGQATLDYSHNHTLRYIEIPLLLKYKLTKSKFNPYVQAGVFYSMLQSAKKSVHAESRDGQYKDDAIVDIKQLINNSNLGLCAGAGFQFTIKDFRLEVEANYKFGFKNIVNKANRFSNSQLMYAFYDVFDDMKSRTWELNMKILFPITFKAFRR